MWMRGNLKLSLGIKVFYLPLLGGVAPRDKVGCGLFEVLISLVVRFCLLQPILV